MPTSTVTFALKLPSGSPVAGGRAAFSLSGFDLDSGIIIPVVVEAEIATDGTGSVELWPNISGLKNTSYKVTITLPNSQKLELGNIFVPQSDTPVALHMLVPAGALAELSTMVLTQAEYDALEAPSGQTIYLIRAEV
ncbi:hypothetical protein D2T29_13815 [Sinirhodobacter populi]|uniref:Minor tail protein gp31 C-terminal domain-containing protein n=1 Tax=Paenirhodobacter populi TaxID=2306993 RepID=A0A443KAT8_9RHOB|nr:hypothetical protein [Sinirhodobacter populi]RWR29855.1 hypothetical protein D2T29_13815 [Sinirhodobacter populi]